MKWFYFLMLFVFVSSLCPEPVFSEELLTQRTENFAKDPGWEGFRNRLLPDPLPTVKQQFGHRSTNFAGGVAAGEIGGRVQRSITPATYFMPVKTLTFEDPFTASGRFAVRNCEGGSGIMIGWFHDSSRGWRTPNSLAFRIDGNGGKYWVFYEYGTTHGKTGGAGCFEGERYQTTKTPPFKADGTAHRWELSYDPRAADGLGAMTLAIDETVYPPVELTAEHRKDGIALNRFGIWNVQIAGAQSEIYLDDLKINDVSMTFDSDPGWKGEGNQVEFEDRIKRPHHDFGYSVTSLIHQEPGELAGVIFRDERPAFYAVPSGKLSLDDPLEASGKFRMESAAADSGFCLGWFNAETKRNKATAEYQERATDYVAAMIEGPSRIGHYFRGAYSTSKGGGMIDGEDVSGTGALSVVHPDGKVHEWKLRYDPAGAEGRGTIEVMFDGERRTFALRPGDRKAGARFDHFGVFNIQAGGHHVQFAMDDLTYTAREE